MKIENIKINKLKVAKYNPRKKLNKNDSEFQAILKSLDTFGMVEPIVVNSDYTVIGGHQRVNVYKFLNKKEIPCNVVNLDDKKEKQLNLALNKISGKWDDEKLFNVLESLKDDISMTGFNESDLLQLEKDLEKFNNEIEDQEKKENTKVSVSDDKYNLNDVIEETKSIESISNDGFFYQLGNHYLLCGDSTNYKHIDKLISYSNMNLNDIIVFTDPPYGIDIVGNNNNVGGCKIAKARVYDKVIGDETTDTAKKNFECFSRLGIEKYILWGGNYFLDFLPNNNLYWLVWDKRGDMTSDNFGDGEIAITNIKSPLRIFKHVWRGMIQEGTRENRIHPTQKPVEMLINVLKTYKRKHNFKCIIDFFAGSGSSLLSAEKLNISSLNIEMSKKYCDLIIKRFIDYRFEFCNGKVDDLYLIGDNDKKTLLSEMKEFEYIFNE